MNKAACNQSTLIRKGRVFDFFTENITLPNGVVMDMEIIRHPGAAAVVPVMEDNSVLLLKQYRHAVGGFIWEIPAGTVNQGENARRCAERELIEETGFRAGQLTHLLTCPSSPGMCDEMISFERIHLFLATGLAKAAQNLDADELLFVHRVAVDVAIQMIAEGEIHDAKTIAGLHLAKARLAGCKK